MNDLPISDQSLEELVEERQAFVEQAGLAEAGRKILDEEIISRLKRDHLNGAAVNGLAVTITSRVTYSPPIEWARELGAIKEEIDAKKVKILANKGVEIPGEKKVTEYLMVRAIEATE